MNERINRIASAANIAAYDKEGSREYIDGAPHIKHARLRLLYGQLLVRVFDQSRTHVQTPHVLDLGAGEGSVTLPFLELGARVTAIDISADQLDGLRKKCAAFKDSLMVRCEDINDSLNDTTQQYDIVVANSFLHHVPDYLGMLGKVLAILAPFGQFFSFQDPLRYDTIGAWPRAFSKAAFVAWRLGRGDVAGGLKRHLRRKQGVYLANSEHDNAEYHVVRNGVDQEGIRDFFTKQEFDCEIVPYFSTQSRLFQPLGMTLGIRNTFAVIAAKRR